MGNFFYAVKRAFQAMGEAPAGERYTVGGKAVACLHCKHDRFVEGRAQLNTAGMTFFRSANGVWLTDNVPPEYIEEHRP